MKKYKFYSLQDYYYKLYLNQDKHFKIIKTILFILIFGSIPLILFINFNYIFLDLILLILVFIYKKIFDLLYFFFKFEINMRLEVEKSRQVVTNKFAKILKIFGNTGVGKDSIVSAMMVANRNYLIDTILNTLQQIKNILYIYDFDELENLISTNENFLNVSSNSKQKEIIDNFLYKNECFILKNYRNQINADDHFNRLDGFIYNDGINQIHFLDKLHEYIKLFYRFFFIPNYVMSNHPVKEVDGLMAKIFSINYLKLVKERIYNKYNRKYYTSKIQMPFVDYIIILQTEVDTWFSNLDKNVRSELTNSGIRDAEAFKRHLIGEHSYFYQIGQSSNRTDKTLRELTHACLHVVDSQIIEGGQRRNKYLKKKINKQEKKVYKLEKKINKNNFIKFFTNKKKNRLIKLKKKLANNYLLVEKNKNEGYIQYQVTYSKSENATNVNNVTLDYLLDNNLKINNYSCILTFPIVDCWTHHNTHYLNALRETISEQSKLTFKNVDNWNDSFKMTREEALKVGYNRLNTFYNFSLEEVLKQHYELDDEERG